MRSWLCLVVALASCSGKKDDPKPSVGSAQPPGSANVLLFVNDQQVGAVAPAHVATWPRLDTLLPLNARRLGTWEAVYLKGKAEKPSELNKPSAQYPELVPALFPGEGGASAFGMFDPVELAKHGKPALREDNLHEVRIRMAENSGRGEHEQGSGGGNDPMEMKITIVTGAGRKVITGKQLLDIPREPFPGETGEGRGWTIETILKLAGVTKFTRLNLVDAAGMNLNLEKSDFVPGKSIPFAKLNRQGALRIRIFKKQGTGWDQSGDLRGLTEIQVVD